METILPVIIMMNNYFHDVATALLTSSAVVLLALYSYIRHSDDRQAGEIFKIIFKFTGRLALIALIWIILGGIPRVIFFKKYEWWDAAAKNIIPALVVKHIVMFVLTGGGIWLWLKIKRNITFRK